MNKMARRAFARKVSHMARDYNWSEIVAGNRPGWFLEPDFLAIVQGYETQEGVWAGWQLFATRRDAVRAAACIAGMNGRWERLDRIIQEGER